MAKKTLVDPQYTKFDLEVSNQADYIELSEETLLVLGWMFGWNNASNKWKPIQTDNTGRMLVSTGSSQVDTPTTSKVTVTSISGLLLGENEDRLAFSIYNNGSEPIYINLGSDDATVDSFPIPSGGFYSNLLYAGEINAISASGNVDVRIQEFA